MSMINDLFEWIGETNNLRLLIPFVLVGLISILVFVVGGLILLGGHNNVDQPTPTPIVTPEPVVVNASPPTITPTATPIPTPKPEYNNNMSYEQWVVWVTQYYYNCSIPESQGHIDPLSREAYDAWKQNESKNIANTPRIDDSRPYGARIYDPKATPTPSPSVTPTPYPYNMEKHSKLLDVDAKYIPAPDHTGTTSGILAYDPGHSHGIYDYYYQGDITAIQLHFINDQYKTDINNEHMVLVIKKQVLGQYITVIEQKYDYTYHVDATRVDQYEGSVDRSKLPGFTTGVISFSIPETFNFGGAPIDTRGSYILEIKLYVDNVQACEISQDIAIL